MIQTQIQPLSSSLASSLIDKINNKTKPLGSLGRLEKIALQVGLIQGTLTPELNKPVMMVFAGDHGIVQAGVSPFPQEVTQQMVFNFLSGGAAINVFAQTNAMQVRVIDAGVNHEFGLVPGLIDAKVGMGTQNFLTTPAMSKEQCEQALTIGISLAHKEFESGSNVMAFGEMGIGNTSSASALMAVLCELLPEQCVGRGTGLDDAGLQKKIDVIKAAIAHHKLDAKDPNQVLATFGGFEIALMVGAMLGAAEKKCVLLIDGFIATAALLVASKMQPEVLDYCVFAHCSNESGHRLLLNHLKAEPLLDLGLRLGEGTGAALAYPLLKAAVNFLNEMASFESANVSQAE
ncbi:MAG: nicotinate-nucleotide--dimethylbenzimidazole phosphoribosyltransferase [Methylophilaceae bacterium]|nr:nicotinate-nucleotide--dimethylbenzimidazole phosphoribosyltransferase [Methyloradius sp.]